jgi:S-formylglutathione hydrolase FrmB
MKKLLLFLLLFSFKSYAASVDTVQIYSNAMHRAIKAVVITPEGYASKTDRYPVVYLLHGYSGNYANWLKRAPVILTLADAYQVMIICPDGQDSWYMDSPIDTSVRFETYVGTEIPAYIDAHYRTKADRAHRAICGLSMGGQGAFYLGIRHQDTFGAVGSLSGAVDTRTYPKNWGVIQLLGTIEEHRENWDQFAIIEAVDKGKLKRGSLAIIFECGVDDALIDVNRALHEKLLAKNIDHDYAEKPGEHNWKYWTNAIEYQMLFFHKFFSKEAEKSK